jgi:hypothetical protein
MEIKQDLGSSTNDPDWYIQAFITVIQTFELAWKDAMLLLIRPLRWAMIITYESPLLSPHP